MTSAALKLFANWKPPAGFDFKEFYDYVDGNGGIAIVEATSAEVMLEAFAPWAVFFEFTVRPIVPTEKSTPHPRKSVRLARLCALSPPRWLARGAVQRVAMFRPANADWTRRPDDAPRVSPAR